MPASKYTEAQRAEALELYKTDGPSAAADKLGIPKQTIQDWARKSGVRTVRTEATRAAVEAKVADGKLRRQNIVHRLYGQAEKILDDLESTEFRTLLKGQGGSDHEETLTFVPPNDRKTLVQALGSAMTTTANLEKLDVATNNHSAVDAWLEHVTGGISGKPE